MQFRLTCFVLEGLKLMIFMMVGRSEGYSWRSEKYFYFVFS